MVFAIHPHELATGIHVSLPPPSPPYPSGLSQRTGFGCPGSWIKLALVIYFTYDNILCPLKSSHSCLLPQNPKVCSLHLCLFSPAPFFFLKITLAIRGLLCFHINCEIFLSSSLKNAIGNLIVIAMNL